MSALRLAWRIAPRVTALRVACTARAAPVASESTVLCVGTTVVVKFLAKNYLEVMIYAVI